MDHFLFKDEDYYGCVEYKRYFNNKKLEKYTTQLLFRLNEGYGKSIYLIGINDNGSIYGLNDKELEININFMKKMVKNINCRIELILKCIYKDKNFVLIKIMNPNHNKSIII